MLTKSNLKNPSMEYRPIPFWSWNDKLESNELRHQIDLMHSAGIGGYFMHARGGLLTQYMGDEWFHAVDSCLEQGDKNGMQSWAYDENGWPSGFGDGRVNGLGVDYQQKYLRCETVSADQSVRSDRTITVHPTSAGMVRHFYYEVNPHYVDTLDPKVTNAFIEAIYRPYYERLRTEGHSPSELTGFFTDEPQISRNGMPWSFILPDEYKRAYGEDLLDQLPLLFFREDDFRRTRYQVWKLITELFMNNYMKPLYEWCEARGWKITGHHVLEETYADQLTSNGAIMPQYQYYHTPGMDWLGRKIMPVTTPVQVASVCAQLGKKQILSETFALCGWNVKPEELKWMYQWQMVHGVNLLCQHLESYSLKGIRKRDYPASLFRHLPWWEEYRDFNDYVSRIGLLLAEGEIQVDVLVLHGQSSAWLEYTANEPANRNKAIADYFHSFYHISNLLDSYHVNYHYGDETMIEMHGSVAEGVFTIGRQNYSTVVVPQMSNLSRSVCEHLRQFVTEGGKVLAVRNTIDDTMYVGGSVDPQIDSLLDQFRWFESEDELAAEVCTTTGEVTVVRAGTDRTEIRDLDTRLGQINYTRRYFPDLDGEEAVLYYFVNNDLHNGVDAAIYLPDTSAKRFDPSSGEITPIAFSADDKGLVIRHTFVPAGDLLIIASASAGNGLPMSKRSPATSRNTIGLSGEYAVELRTDNLLTLDHCAYLVDGEKQSEREYVLSIHDRLLDLRREANVELIFTFVVDDRYDFSKDLLLVIERPELYAISINGSSVASEDVGYIYDPAFRRIPIGSHIQPGENTISLSTVFKQPASVYETLEAAAEFEAAKNKLSYAMEIEAIYLSGQFGVATTGTFSPLDREACRYEGDFALTARPEAADLERLHECRLPFFAGTVVLSKEFEVREGETNDRVLKFTEQKAAVSRVRINGRELAKFLWKPFEADLTDMLIPGTNFIEVELTNSLRNMLGPHHLEAGESYAVGPSSFYKDKGVFSHSLGDASRFWNDHYCFAEFGMANLRIE